MQNTERQKFEENWKDAFDGAGMTPSDRVWNSIELDLAGQESTAMKKRVVFYQRLAAAMVVFALVTGVYAWYPKDGAQMMVKNEVTKERGDEGKMNEVTKEEVVKEQVAENRAVEGGRSSKEVVVSSKESGVRSKEQGVSSKELVVSSKEVVVSNKESVAKTIVAKQTTVTPEIIVQQTESESPIIASEIQSPENSIALATTTDTDKTNSDKAEEKQEEKSIAVVSPLLQPNDITEEVVQPRKKSRESNLWLALGASAGNYAPNTPSTNTGTPTGLASPQFAYADASQKAQPKVGTSYSFGMAVGKKFGRVVVQTGINLGKQQIDYSSNYSAITSSNSAKAASSDYLASNAENLNMGYTSAYTVNSTMEIVSIPVQAGYMIIDRKLGWQFNAGVSPDFFLKNTLVDKSGQRDRFSQSAGDESPYRTLNWSGLLNTELSYRIGPHYRLSLVPGVRYSFNSILKDPSDKGRPVIMDVGFRFRYLFD